MIFAMHGRKRLEDPVATVQRERQACERGSPNTLQSLENDRCGPFRTIATSEQSDESTIHSLFVDALPIGTTGFPNAGQVLQNSQVEHRLQRLDRHSHSTQKDVAVTKHLSYPSRQKSECPR